MTQSRFLSLEIAIFPSFNFSPQKKMFGWLTKREGSGQSKTSLSQLCAGQALLSPHEWASGPLAHEALARMRITTRTRRILGHELRTR